VNGVAQTAVSRTRIPPPVPGGAFSSNTEIEWSADIHVRLRALVNPKAHPKPTGGQECPMPLGFDPPHPGGMAENSPTFQRWGREFRGAQVPKGRLEPCTICQPSLRDLPYRGRWFPTLKRWATIVCPSGTVTWPGSAGLLWEQILAALDKNVRAPEKCEMRTSLFGPNTHPCLKARPVHAGCTKGRQSIASIDQLNEFAAYT
jgi:hypothetical protein